MCDERHRTRNTGEISPGLVETKAYPRLQAEGFDRMSNRIRLISADLRRGGGLQAAVGRARLDRYTSAWRPKPRQRPTLALSSSLEDDPNVPADGETKYTCT